MKKKPLRKRATSTHAKNWEEDYKEVKRKQCKSEAIQVGKQPRRDPKNMEASTNTAKIIFSRTQAATKYTKTKESKVQKRNMQSCSVINQVRWQSTWRYEKKQFKE